MEIYKHLTIFKKYPLNIESTFAYGKRFIKLKRFFKN